MPKIFHTLEKIKPAYDWTEKIVMVLCKVLLIVDIIIATYTVIGRYCQQLSKDYPDILGFLGFIKDPSWSEEIVLTCMSYLAVLAAAIAIRHGSHIRMTALDRYLPPIVIKVLDIAADLAVCIFGVIMLIWGWKAAFRLWNMSYISLTWLPRFWMYFPVPLAGFAMIIFELEALFNHIKSFFVEDGKEEQK